ncbi:hypothetical protein PYW07_009539 [Mythimna separata]|uniref:non-specific serine/threonine protein kinase n=1 Tax=Mythimna separata TaxID=271217 RepID=A0AAD7YBQ1_MYTSE|nr:hypothetical protein PYW07_009539 [Mythimna separata]
MGNQLVGVAPSQIYPVEHYLSDHVDLSFDMSLGSTRFLKVARARSREGLVVVKVFAVHDPSLPLAEHKERILKIKEQLVSAFNCLPFQRVILTDKAGLLMREYCKCSVYDRMSTRPFLTTLEKKWITFQVLYALHRMHKLGICHGDIKLENVMVTSWLWVLLTDIASFKPTFLPDDNPADFSYFFDTSRRRLCYVAPERFVRAPDPHNRPTGDDKMGGLLLSESPCKVGELVPSMDIFSAGCALLELWNDGTPALDLPGLLAYRNGEDRPASMTLATDEPQLKALLHSMTERNPRDRRTAELYLDEARGKLFPEYFYSFLQSYMLIFSAQPILPPDEKILRIHQDIKNIIKIFTQPSDAKNYQDLVEETTEHQNIDNIDKLKDKFKVLNVNTTDFDEDDDKAPERKDMGPDSEGLILITSLVTSCIRGLHHCTSKLYSLEILQLLCENSSSETILDRILPYIIHLSHDSVPRVRACAVATCARAVSLVRSLPNADCNVFPEYILPELAPRAADPSVPVRIAYANNIVATCARAVSLVRALPNADCNVFPEYILPELAPRAADPSVPVRIAYANNIVATCARAVSLVRALPNADCNVFPEYILPELAPRAADPSVPVRIAYANNIVATCARAVSLVRALPNADCNVFPEYILPELAPRAADPSVPVRIAYANNIVATCARAVSLVRALPNADCNVFPEYILPELAPRAADPSVPVRIAYANNIVATCARAVSLVRALPNADCNVFPEYILPELAPRAADPSVPVRIAYANNIVATCARAVSLVRALPNADCNVFPEYILPELAPRAADPSVPVRIAYANNIVATCARAVSLVRALPNADCNVFPEYILPELAPRAADPSVPVRIAYANNIVATCARAVSLVRALPNADCNVFPEYILPELAPRAADPSVPVRIAYANNIAKLAETAVRFLDQTQNMVDKEAANINYETELSALHEMVRSTVSYLLTDSQAIVKRALVENGITKLCIFFGKQKANDVILSHMVTFLNDKEEAALRGCFFERLVGVAAYVGHHAAPILVPLLQQGLTDQSEWIIAKALRATTNLAELGLLPKQALCDLVAESAVFLAHPNLWIRHEVCGLVSCVASLLNMIDVHCKILPLVWPHLKHKLIQVERAELLLESLAEPIPRKVLDAVLRHGDVDRLVQTLRERRNTRLKVKQGTVVQYSEMGQQLKNLFRRLGSDGMTEHVENQLLAMSAHLIKIQGSSTQHITEAPGRLNLQTTSISRAVQLDSGATDAMPHVDKLYTSTQNRRTHKTSVSHETHMNTEWQHMFGQSHEQHSREGVSQSQAASGSGVASQAMSVPPHHSQLGHSASYVQYSMAPCRIELRDLTARMQQKYQKSLRSHDDPLENNEDIIPPAGWRPGNQLLAYLHEHKARVNQLVTLPAHRSLFGSCSDDGTVRLWDAARLHTQAHINRSKSMYNRNAGPVISIAACEGGQSLVAATQESVFVLRVDGASSRMNLSQGRQLEGDGDDAVCVAAPAHAAVISYATLFASIVGWDLRAPGNAWKLQGDLKQGVCTCLYADPCGYLAVGTSSGAVCVWDLRFQLPITSVRHPNSERVRRIVGGGSSGSIWVAGGRDAAAWSLESTQRTHALWPSTNCVQPLQYTPAASHYISSIYCGVRDGSRFAVTGGSDLRLRYWNLEQPEDSYVLLHAHNDALRHTPNAVKYRSRIIDGTTVIQECCKLNPSTPASLVEDNIYRSVESRSFYHTAPITDLTMVEGTKPYLVSSSADGVINVWK